jgi:hypothetical protein
MPQPRNRKKVASHNQKWHAGTSPTDDFSILMPDFPHFNDNAHLWGDFLAMFHRA